MRVIAALLVFLMLSGCAMKNYRNLCNALYCNPKLEGKTMAQVSDDFGPPRSIEVKGSKEIWSYDVAPLWQFGSKGQVVVFFDSGIVSEGKFYPTQSSELPQQ